MYKFVNRRRLSVKIKEINVRNYDNKLYVQVLFLLIIFYQLI